MTRIENVVSIFVASPSDVQEERELLEDIIRELNLTWSKTLGIRMELVKWETHTRPGVGVDAQEVINSQIDDYDIFIGIMWKRFGTPTLRGESGTAEEFERAYKRYKLDRKSVRILFYFKDTPVAPSEIIPEELAAIRNFMNKLAELGAFYWIYKDKEDFSASLRMHLSREIQGFMGSGSKDKVETAVAPVNDKGLQKADAEEEEEGFLDLFEQAGESLERATGILLSISQSMAGMSITISKSVTDLRKITLSGRLDMKEFRKVNDLIASQMTYASAAIETDLPHFAEATKKAFNFAGRAIVLFLDFRSSDTSSLEDILMRQKALLEKVKSSESTTLELREMVASLPRMTTKFNHARRKMVNVLDKLADETRNYWKTIDETNTIIVDTIKRASGQAE